MSLWLWLPLIACWLFGGAAPALASPNPQEQGSHLVRRAEIGFTVTNVEQTAAELNQLAGLVHGHFEGDRIQMILLDDGQHELHATLNLPPEFMDTALARLRGMAVVIFHEQLDSQDVGSQLNELQGRLDRLRVRRRQLRDLLEQADTSDERQQVQTQLSEVEANIAEGEAALAELQQQLDWAVIQVSVHQAPATPTPSPTLAAPSSTPTALAPPVTPGPTSWRPGETARQASRTLVSIFQVLANALIAVTIVGGPFLISGLLGLWVLRRLSR
jgi:hypothetical protein